MELELGGRAVQVLAATAAAALACRLVRPRRESPPPDQHADLVREAVDWAAGHGLLVRGEKNFDHCPVSLLPTVFPRAAFDGAVALGPLFARLVDRISRDHEWLHSTLAAAADGDAFTAKLLSISRQVAGAEGLQPLQVRSSSDVCSVYNVY